MNNEPSSANSPLTRRDILLRACLGTVATAAASPLVGEPIPAPSPEPEFVPENDYPFFGFEPEAG